MSLVAAHWRRRQPAAHKLVYMGRTLLIDAIGAVIEIDGSALSDDGWAAVESAWSGANMVTAADPSATVAAHGTVTTGSMLASLSIDVTLAALKQRAGEVVLLHAAGLATTDGRVVVLVGPSGRGKTTASRVLGRHFGYVSDESVGIEADGTVLPYRKPLSIIEDERYLKVQRSPDELGLLPLTGAPLRVAALVLLERDDSARAARMERMDLAEGLVGLAEQASYLARQARPLGTLLAHIAAAGGVHRATYGDVATLMPEIARLAARMPARPLMPEHSARDRIAASPAITSAWGLRADSAPTFRRAPVLDACALADGRLVLLLRHDDHANRVVALDGIAPAIWEAAAQPATLEALTAATIARHGEPPGANAVTVVAASVEEMVREGVLMGDAR